ncbi:hypothetical protein Lesp02_22360 [Lentzea sp. NBRC 105346]|uniref:hypothetical protein n=1 Tax=Lentzea sp. NBRC 105346 TaxID=3032205 RepID=UPI0024A59C08|nr:hypothetical protein [Lentzea sp. NBRC 105346]GLZ30046.1 hypothetical protein Lesp02_22360 [Lentzea sp. NBRC 105346]
MRMYEESMDVAVPVAIAYHNWTSFEAFPWFGTRGEVVERRPVELIVWRSTSGPDQSGRVRFERVDDGSTRIHLSLQTEPEGVLDQAAAATGLVAASIRSALERYKEFVEHGHVAMSP